MSSNKKKSAEKNFREAFGRLKENCPKNLPLDTPVSQNNVAKEAGKHPTALKKERFPLLIGEIQAYVESRTESKNSSKSNTHRKKRKLTDKLRDVSEQRDRLASIVESQDNYIAELLEKISALEAGTNVTTITPT